MPSLGTNNGDKAKIGGECLRIFYTMNCSVKFIKNGLNKQEIEQDKIHVLKIGQHCKSNYL